MKTVFLTNYENLSKDRYNLIWDSYFESKNCKSINNYINKNSKYFKKKTIDEINNISNKIISNSFFKKFYRFDDNFNFFNTVLLNEKNFYKDKYGSLNNLIKCLALSEIVKKNKIEEIIFNINDYDIFVFLKNFCKVNNIFFRYRKKTFILSYLNNIKEESFFVFGLINFLRFLIKRLSLPKPKTNFLSDNNSIFVDYLAYFNHQKFIKGKYESQFWGKLFKKVNINNKKLFLHIYDPQCKLTKKEIAVSLSNLNSQKFEKHIILDSILNVNIVKSIFKKWFFFWYHSSIFNKRLDKIFFKEKNKFYYLFKKSFSEYSYGFNGLINIYFYYLFKSLFKNQNLNKIEKKFFYLCENQGWEKSFIHFVDKSSQSDKIFPIIYTPIRFWDLRYFLSDNERKMFTNKIQKICVISIFSKNQLIKNMINPNKIKVVEALRYENLIKLNLKKEITKAKRNILLIGDVYKESNIFLENYFLRFSKLNNKFKFIAKPHPNRKFSKNFASKNIKISNQDIYSLTSKTNIAVCSNMTAASYDLSFLGINTFIFLSGDGLDFSPIKNLINSKYIYDYDRFDYKFKNLEKNRKLIEFRKKAFLFDINYKSWKEVIYV